MNNPRHAFTRLPILLALLLTACGNPSTAGDAQQDAMQSDAVDHGSAGDVMDVSDAPVLPDVADVATTCANPDVDGDMHRSAACGGDDCDDTDPLRHPGATETCDTMGRDEDCDPLTFGFRDADGDSSADSRCCNTAPSGVMTCGDDCNDSRPNIHPGLAEVCDGLDNDCNGMLDEGVQRTFHPDRDGDGFGDGAGATMMGCSPPAGYSEMVGDCDDTVASVHPGAVEACDAAMVDENCDGTANPASICMCSGDITRACSLPGACAAGTQRCVSGSWGSCTIVPVAEVCNGVDDNCDGTVDEALTVTCYPDGDNDGYASSGAVSLRSCPDASRGAFGGCPSNQTNRPPLGIDIDCNDTSAAIHPGAAEICNGADENCNGMIDEGVSTTFYRDADGDGFGVAAMTVVACSAPPGYVSTGTDCDDTSPARNPAASEICDGIDNNCNGSVDEGVATSSYYPDCDHDGFGAAVAPIVSCSMPTAPPGCPSVSMWVTNGTDCNDANATAHPGAVEICDAASVDENCNGAANEGCSCVVGMVRACIAQGVCAGGNQSCVAGGWGACSIGPTTEICNGLDDNCNGTVDEGLRVTCYADADNDGYAATGATTMPVCPVPTRPSVGGCPVGLTNRAPTSGSVDCNDTSAAIHPGAAELCDAAMVDENCDGIANPSALCACSGSSTRSCPLPGVCAAGLQTCSSGAWGACSISPTTEICNGVDDNCNGLVDDACI